MGEEQHWKPSDYEQAIRDGRGFKQSDKPILIGFCGPAGAGKSTAANILVTQYGFIRLAFADTLKSMLKLVLKDYGYDDDTANRYINGDLKEQPCPALGGTSCRYAQQALGTEWGRDRIHPDLWTNVVGERMVRLNNRGVNRFVIDDVRMVNEAEVITNRALIWHTALYRVRPADGQPHRHPPQHRSENGIPNMNLSGEIEHDWTLDRLTAQIEAQIINDMGITKPEGTKWQTT